MAAAMSAFVTSAVSAGAVFDSAAEDDRVTVPCAIDRPPMPPTPAMSIRRSGAASRASRRRVSLFNGTEYPQRGDYDNAPHSGRMRNRPGIVLAVLLAVLLAAPLVGTVAAQDTGGDAGEAEEGGIEGAIEGAIEGHGLVGAGLVLLAGLGLLTLSTEKLISYLTRASLSLRTSLFGLAVLFTGFEFDDTVLALVFSSGGMGDVALGTALGTGLAITGFTLALASILNPFSVDIPRDYVVLLAVAPLLLVPFAIIGTLTLSHGLVLIGMFILMFGYILVREARRETPVFRSTALGEELETDGDETLRADGGSTLPTSVQAIPEDRLLDRLTSPGWAWVGLSVLALAGIVLASMLLEVSSEVAVERTGIEGTVFGATVLTAILTFEDIMLTLEPIRRGVPEIGIGNVIGSVLFSVTGNVGVIMLLGELTIAPAVLTFHLPVIIVVTAVAAYALSTGRVGRRHGLALGGCYVAYWLIAVLVFGGVPISG